MSEFDVEAFLSSRPEADGRKRAFLAEVEAAGGPSAWEQRRMLGQAKAARHRLVAKYGETFVEEHERRVTQLWDRLPPMPGGIA